MQKIKRAVILILDSAGIGELPDADKYGDIGSNTLANIAKAVGGLKLPNFEAMGLGNIYPIKGIKPTETPIASFGKMDEKSPGKDTTTGHWELCGLILPMAFPTYPDGFPEEVIEKFETLTGKEAIGNKPASGTVIIDELGEEHVKTGKPIVYTSADSVFQIAAHEEVIPLEELYKICRISREMLKDKHCVGRVIARPFVGTCGNFKRTYNRKDFALKPFEPTLLDMAKEKGFVVWGIGKIEDIFSGQGLTKSTHTDGNTDGINKMKDAMKGDFEGILFVNLVDFDMLYGHRNDPQGYANALMEADAALPEILNNLKETDLLIITADHGCDPTTSSTDHSREYVPLLVYGKTLKNGVNFGTLETFSDIAATIADFLEIKGIKNGKSFRNVIEKF